ncbi:MAG: Dabb family protein [Planctomycetia bacterium]|nr:Dabb family protein [Planctomycetia bacterium]
MLFVSAAVGLSYAWRVAVAAEDKPAAGKLLAHNVYFTLNDATPEARQKLVDACKKYLSHHKGTVFFACGTLCDEIKGNFNDRDYDVALVMVFADRAALANYARSADHQTFIAEVSGSLKGVRIFDADVERVASSDAPK